MKLIIQYFLFLKFIFKIFCVVPLWDFERTAINLLSENSITYLKYSREDFHNVYGDGKSIKYELYKTLQRQSDNTITSYKELKLSYSSTNVHIKTINVNWENIESTYQFGNIVYICPQGKFHVYKWGRTSASDLEELIPSGFSYNDNWELQCFYQNSITTLFVGYLNKIYFI